MGKVYRGSEIKLRGYGFEKVKLPANPDHELCPVPVAVNKFQFKAYDHIYRLFHAQVWIEGHKILIRPGFYDHPFKELCSGRKLQEQNCYSFAPILLAFFIFFPEMVLLFFVPGFTKTPLIL